MTTLPTGIVVDDAAVIREALPGLIPAIRFVGAYQRVEQALAAQHDADLMILDLHLANDRQPSVRQGVAAIRAAAGAGYRVCVFSQEERPFVLAACVAAGAAGVVSKAAPIAEARTAFAEVCDGQVVIPPALFGLVEMLVRRNSLTVLGPRQRDVLAGRARGLTYAEMASQMFLAESTLRGYWGDLTAALSVHLQQQTPAELEQTLGLGAGDLLEYWPDESTVPSEWWRLRPPAR